MILPEMKGNSIMKFKHMADEEFILLYNTYTLTELADKLGHRNSAGEWKPMSQKFFITRAKDLKLTKKQGRPKNSNLFKDEVKDTTKADEIIARIRAEEDRIVAARLAEKERLAEWREDLKRRKAEKAKKKKQK